jgi:4-pyridoxate dehydrogenase
MLRSYFFGSGPASTIPAGLQAFVKTSPELELPDIEFTFRSIASQPHAWFPGIRKPYRDTFGIRPTLLHPKSRGQIRLRSADPASPPRVIYNALSASEDLQTLCAGFDLARQLASSPAMTRFRGKELAPGLNVKSRTEIEEFIRRVAVTAHHPAGTCKMGVDDQSVVSPDLKVRGIDKLRVIDASIMPDLVSGHINACAIMIAEKGADLVRGIRGGMSAINVQGA